MCAQRGWYMMDNARADFSRTCDGCAFLKSEDWARGKTAFRCFAPGPNKGYHMGTERVFPWIPAWCPVKLREERNYKEDFKGDCA